MIALNFFPIQFALLFSKVIYCIQWEKSTLLWNFLNIWKIGNNKKICYMLLNQCSNMVNGLNFILDVITVVVSGDHIFCCVVQNLTEWCQSSHSTGWAVPSIRCMPRKYTATSLILEALEQYFYANLSILFITMLGWY